MKRKRTKPFYLKVRLPLLVKRSGAHVPAKGGKYRRSREKATLRKYLPAELK